MPLQIDGDRKRILDEAGPVLVTGGPGCGKTTIALAKAQALIERGLRPGQHVLFLSFSRAAVARVVEASKLQLPKALQSTLSIQTFHSLFWEILKAHGYLLGAPRRLRLLLPQDEAALKNQVTSEDNDWTVERERLFHVEGRVAFDLFAPKTRALLSDSSRIRGLVARRYPMIVVDEAQDTADDQWQCVRLIAQLSQLVCLADMEQQIYAFRPGVSAERVQEIMAELQPLRIDLQGQNHRSPHTEIAAFGNDLLLATPRGAPYVGVSRISFRPKAEQRDQTIRQAIGRLYRAQARADRPIQNLAILAPSRRGVAVVSAALRGVGEQRPIPHRVVFNEAPALLASRLVAFLMEPRRASPHELIDLAEALDLLAAVFRARGGKGNLAEGAKFAAESIRARAGQAPGSTRVAGKLLALIQASVQIGLTGDPKRDWLALRDLFRSDGCKPIASVAENIGQLVLFQRGARILNALTDLWQSQATYSGARGALDNALAEDYLLDGSREVEGIHVMTVHASKGKEFDAIVFFEDAQISPLIYGDEPPFHASRRLLRVALTRARNHALLLTGFANPTPLLDGHLLAEP